MQRSLPTATQHPGQANEMSPPLTAPGAGLSQLSTRFLTGLAPACLFASPPPGARWSQVDKGNPRCPPWRDVQSVMFQTWVSASITLAFHRVSSSQDEVLI